MQKHYSVRYNRWFFKSSWIVYVCLISVLMSRFAMGAITDMLAIGKQSQVVQLEITNDISINELSQILFDNKVISEKWFFKLYSFITKSPKTFPSGMYELETNMDYQSIMNHINVKNDNKEVVKVTITEGLNVLECAELLQKNEICSKEDFLKVCNSDKFDDKYSFVKDIASSTHKIYKMEGYLFPDTYTFYKKEKAENVVNKFLSNYQKKIQEKLYVEKYGSEISISEIIQEKKISLDRLTIIASLIQAEAANKDDMYKVSSVIYNRLDTEKTVGKSRFGEFAMNKLQIDATVRYPYRNEKSIPSELNRNFTSSYNTYELEGLPPGAVCNPGIEAFYAALFPEKTDYYYYCHSESGETFFARTNEAHISNLKKAGLI